MVRVQERSSVGRLSLPLEFPCLDPAYWPKPGEMISNDGCPRAYGMDGLGISLMPEAVNDMLNKISESTGEAVAAIVPLGIGGIVIFGSAVLPSEPKWLKYVKIGGIGLGVLIGSWGALRAVSAASTMKPEGAVPGAGETTSVPPFRISASPEKAWSLFGKSAPRLDLKIYNEGGEARTLMVRFKHYLGKNPDPEKGSFIFGLPDRDITVPSGGKIIEPFYLVEEHLKNVPGDRSAMFEIFDKKTGNRVANHPVRFKPEDF